MKIAFKFLLSLVMALAAWQWGLWAFNSLVHQAQQSIGTQVIGAATTAGFLIHSLVDLWGPKK